MKTVAGFKIRPLGTETVLIPEKMQTVNFNKMISLNSSAAFLWKSVVGKDFTVDDLADALVAEYGIDRELALTDSKAIAEKWIEAGIVEE